MKVFRTTIVLLILLAVGVFAAQWLAQEHTRDFGRVFVEFGGNDWETDVPRALLSLLLVAGVVWLLLKLLTLPFRAWARHRRKQARARLIEGLDNLHGGHWNRAEKLLERATEDDEVGAVARIAAVRAADAREDEAAARRHLEALAQRSAAAHALTAADRALARQSPIEALTALESPSAQPLPPRGLSLRAQALTQLNRSGEAYGLLGAMKQQQSLSSGRLDALEKELAARAVREAGDANVLAERWETLSKPLRNRSRGGRRLRRTRGRDALGRRRHPQPGIGHRCALGRIPGRPVRTTASGQGRFAPGQCAALVAGAPGQPRAAGHAGAACPPAGPMAAGAGIPASRIGAGGRRGSLGRTGRRFRRRRRRCQRAAQFRQCLAVECAASRPSKLPGRDMKQ